MCCATNDGVQIVFEIPRYQALIHAQLVGNAVEQWGPFQLSGSPATPSCLARALPHRSYQSRRRFASPRERTTFPGPITGTTSTVSHEGKQLFVFPVPAAIRTEEIGAVVSVSSI